jgi:hypothetical protein
LRIPGAKQFPATARQQILISVTAAPIEHSASLFWDPDGAFAAK